MPMGTALKATVSVDGSTHNHTPIYTTGSAISGHAVIHSAVDAYCDAAEIVLLGLAGTRLELTRHKPARALSPFLKMYMTSSDPDDGRLELDSPFPGPLSAGETVSIPFRFIVPQYLLEDACRHPCASQTVQERHAHLPPTLDGGGLQEHRQQRQHEFLARGRIQYHVEVRLRCRINAEPKRYPGSSYSCCSERCCDASIAITARRKVTILPALPERPPIPLDCVGGAGAGAFLQQKSLVLRRHLIQRGGRLTEFSIQPPAMMLDPSGRSSSCSVVRLVLDFVPSRPGTAAPRKLAVSSVATGTTRLCSEPSELLPELSGNDGGLPTTVQYTSMQTLFPQTTLMPTWRRITDSASDWSYRAELEMSLSLPQCHRQPVLPTFYSCLISLTYSWSKVVPGSHNPKSLTQATTADRRVQRQL